MHLREEDLYLALDSEAPARSLHLAECDACQRRLADAQLFQGRLTALLSALDHRVRPLPSAAGIMTVSRKRALLRARRRRAIVGGIATALAASAAAAAISVPQLRALAQRLFAPASERQQTDTAATAKVGPRARTVEKGAGIAFLAQATTVIEFHSTQIRGTVQVVLTSGAEVRVEHSGGVPTYRLTPKGVLIDNGASQANYVLQIPRAAPSVIVRIASHTVFLKSRDSLTTVATPDGPDAYILAFSTVTAKAK